MATRNLEKMASIDAQLRLLVPSKVSDDDKLVEYDALLLDRFLDILQDLHGGDIRETVSAMPSVPPHYTFQVFVRFSFVGFMTRPYFWPDSDGFVILHFNFHEMVDEKMVALASF